MHRATNLSSSKSIELLPEETLCDGFHRNDLELRHGCLAGSCGVCLVEVISGAELLHSPKTIELDTLSRIKQNKPELQEVDIRLACKSKIQNVGEVQFKKI